VRKDATHESDSLDYRTMSIWRSLTASQLTQASDYQRNEIPCSHLDQLEDVKKRSESECNHEYDGGNIGGNVSIRHPCCRIVESRTLDRVAGHKGLWEMFGIWASIVLLVGKTAVTERLHFF
jgi:hypothetical protein